MPSSPLEKDSDSRPAVCTLAYEAGGDRVADGGREIVGRYVYVGDRAAKAYESPWIGRECFRRAGWPWRIQAVVEFEDGTRVAAYRRCLRKIA